MANEEILPFHRGGQLPADLRGVFYALSHTTLFIDLPDFQNAYRYSLLDAAQPTD